MVLAKELGQDQPSHQMIRAIETGWDVLCVMSIIREGISCSSDLKRRNPSGVN